MDESIPKNENDENLRRKMKEIYNNLNTEDNSIQKITYLENIKFGNAKEAGEFEEYDVFDVDIVKKDINDPSKEYSMHELYRDDMLIATIDEYGVITFTADYYEYIKSLQMKIEEIIKEQDGRLIDLAEIERLPEEEQPSLEGNSKSGLTMKKEELEGETKAVDRSNREKGDLQREQQEVNQDEKEEAITLIIAAETGITASNIRICGRINPNDMVTDKRSVTDVVGENYEALYIVNAGRGFEIWGEKEDGEVEKTVLEDKHGNKTKSTTHMGKDGEIEQINQKVILSTPDDREGFAITIGQSGKAETSYARRDIASNEFLTANTLRYSPGFNNSNLSAERIEMDKARSGYETGEMLEEAEHDSREIGKAEIDSLDNNAAEQIPDPDTKINLHKDNQDLGTTTIRQEAEKLEITVDEYMENWVNADCISDSIFETNAKIMEKQEQAKNEPEKPSIMGEIAVDVMSAVVEHKVGKEIRENFQENSHPEDRGERPTPEEMALNRLNGNNN